MIEFFVRKQAAVFSFSVLIIIIGVMAYLGLPRESTPEIKQPYIFVTTIYPGVSAKDIENLVTRPIEEEIEGLEGISEITSSSQQSLSFIMVKFASNIAIETALRKTQERVDIAKTELPGDVDEPSVKELSSSSWPILITVLSHPDGLEAIDQGAKRLEDELKRINGVLDVNVAGRRGREVAIDLDPVRLERYGFSLNDVIDALQSEHVSIPGGLLKTDAKNYTLAVTGEIRDPSGFGQIIVKASGVEVPLEELGTARFTWAEQETFFRLNGLPAISLSLSKRAGENIVTIVEEAKEVVERIRPELPEGAKITYSYNESEQIKDMVFDLENNIFSGLVLVLLVTFFFLGSVNALFVSMAIPFSMLLSFFALQQLGITLNMVVLFSLVLALGMLVDNGIVVVENIYRHAAMGKSRTHAAIDGTKEVAMPIFSSTLTTCLAFFPIIFMPGVMGDFMGFVPKTVIIVLASSLVVALTINPVFCGRFLRISRKNLHKMNEGSGKFIQFQSWYERRVKWAVDHPLYTLGICTLIVVAGFLIYGFGGKEPVFFPSMDPADAAVHVETSQGTPLNHTDVLVKRIESEIPEIPASLDNYQATVGRSGGSFFGGGDEFHKANVRLSFNPFAKRKIKGQVSIDSLQKRLKNFTGAEIKVEALEHGPPTGHAISYEIIGDDYAVMGQIADSLQSILKQYGELKLIDSDYEPAKPEVKIGIDRKKASRYGLSTIQIASTLRNAMNGTTIGTFRTEEDEYDIVVRYGQPFRNSIRNLDNLQIIGRNGERVPLSSLADIEPQSSVGVIKRRDLERTVEVWADFYDDVQNKAEIKKEVADQLAQLTLPVGYRVEIGEGEEFRNEATDYLKKAFLIALFLIFIVLIAQFNSIVQPIIVMISVVLSFGGVFWGYFLSGQTFVIIMSGVGCIALAGVVVNNAIVLIDYTHILLREGKHWMDAIVESGKTRLRPVLLTAITTVLGMFPMAWGVSFDFHTFGFQLGSESSEMWKPFAWAMIFGLTFATVMTLVVIPALLSIQYRIKPPKFEEHA